ncbi:hypothetical protein CI109_102761 [Kwoniella shandongensis]|uniref:Uncharacterized protein n=1 Tax=Kwoniella shandongensis TaxID=1734106 RepID=A0A5M6BV36_9TREE|nr:uncharacterized protein CI109_004917 [Kwoniella shandongensis]KAA5526714.1 hypothetical protein CI109_004917 [Kwoniella shandongensis]
MASYETVATGRAKRSTAGNRMRELLEQAHQEDDDDMFAEVEDDEEFVAPQEVRDVFLEDFADTDDEVDLDEEDEEQALRREERKKAKGKSKAIYNPLAGQPKPSKQIRFADPSSSTSTTALDVSLIDSDLDPTNMAPSTLVLALRKQRREAKRAGRSEARRSNLRASTLRTEAEILEKEKQEKENPNRKGRRAQHETGEVRGLRPMTQDELIAAALEEEERNKESLRDWLKKEEEKRELRRVGRKRVRGPRWTWISRTVGKLVEVVGEEEEVQAVPTEDIADTELVEKNTEPDIKLDHSEPASQPEKAQDPQTYTTTTVPAVSETPDTSVPADPVVEASNVPSASVSQEPEILAVAPADPSILPVEGSTIAVDGIVPSNVPAPPESEASAALTPAAPVPSQTEATTETQSAVPSSPSSASVVPQPTATLPPVALTTEPSNPLPVDTSVSETTPTEPKAGPSEVPPQPVAQPLSEEVLSKAKTTDDLESEPSKYMRNYLILSQIPGGLPAELKIVLGDHVDWDEVKYIPSRNRPINRRPPTCPFTGLPAKYRHPQTQIPYATVSAYKEIEALLQNRYVWNEVGGCWSGCEEDVAAEGVEEIDGWWEATNGGWLAGKEIPQRQEVEEEEVVVPSQEEEMEIQQKEVVEEVASIGKGKGKGKRKRDKDGMRASATPIEVVEPVPKKAKGKGKKK